MSFQAMTKVLALQLPAKAKFVLLCLANDCDEYQVCWPSVTTISKDTCIPERTVQRLIGWLTEHGYLATYWDYTDKIRHRKIRHYRLNVSGKPLVVRPDYSTCSAELRKQVIERFQYVCSYCSGKGTPEKGPDGKTWEIDRIVPGSKGGEYIAANVTLSCRTCNNSKRARLAPQNTKSLGAILVEEGCQSEQTRVPDSGTLSCSEPLIESPKAELFRLIQDYNNGITYLDEDGKRRYKISPTSRKRVYL